VDAVEYVQAAAKLGDVTVTVYTLEQVRERAPWSSWP
jgi:hypothetical protein